MHCAFTDTARRNSKTSQRGSMLLESVVAMGLAGILAAGPAYVMSKVIASSVRNQLETQSIVSMRNLLSAQSTGLCNPGNEPTINLNGSAVTLEVHCEAPQQVIVGPVTVTAAKPKVSLSLSSERSFGSPRPLVVSE